MAGHGPPRVPLSVAQDPRGVGECLAKLAWHKPRYRRTGTARGLGAGAGLPEALQPRGMVIATSPGIRRDPTSPQPRPGSRHHSAATAAAGTWLEQGAACWAHLTGHPLASPLPKSAGVFQSWCSPPPPVAPTNWFPAGSSDQLPKDGSSEPGMAGEEREGCNTLSILPSAEYCLGKTMRLFFKCNLREILAFPAAPAALCPPALVSPAPLLVPTAPA